MQFITIKTRPLLPPKDDLYKVMDKSLPKLKDGDILVITSKVLAIHQGRCVPIVDESIKEKERLIMKEADWYIPLKEVPGKHAFLTIKNNTLIASAGIDKSNGNGYYILWPKNLQKLIKEIRSYLKKKFRLKKLAIIVVDSHLMPLHAGTIGIAIGFYGMKPLIDYRGKPDIFGRKLKVTRANIIDSLAAISTLLMGESRERTPMLIIRGLEFIEFTNRNTVKKLLIHPRADVYRPLLAIYRKTKQRVDKRNKPQ